MVVREAGEGSDSFIETGWWLMEMVPDGFCMQTFVQSAEVSNSGLIQAPR